MATISKIQLPNSTTAYDLAVEWENIKNQPNLDNSLIIELYPINEELSQFSYSPTYNDILNAIINKKELYIHINTGVEFIDGLLNKVVNISNRLQALPVNSWENIELECFITGQLLQAIGAFIEAYNITEYYLIRFVFYENSQNIGFSTSNDIDKFIFSREIQDVARKNIIYLGGVNNNDSLYDSSINNQGIFSTFQSWGINNDSSGRWMQDIVKFQFNINNPLRLFFDNHFEIIGNNINQNAYTSKFIYNDNSYYLYYYCPDSNEQSYDYYYIRPIRTDYIYNETTKELKIREATNLIYFQIDNAYYFGEVSMTWQQWLDCEYYSKYPNNASSGTAITAATLTSKNLTLIDIITPGYSY